MALYEFECSEHGRFEKQLPMLSNHVATCPKCGANAIRRFSTPHIRIAIPLRVFQDQPHGQKPVEVAKIPDSSSSDERNYDIPPDYPNLLEV